MAQTASGSLRVLHVISSMAVEAGGPPVVCAGLTGALAQRGCSVAIAAASQPGDTPAATHPAVAVHTFPCDGTSSYIRSAALDAWLCGNISQFDVVHLHAIWQFPTFAAARACWRAGTPYVVAPHGMLDRYSVYHRSRWKKFLYWGWREGKVEGRSAGIHCLNRAEIQNAVPWIASMPKFVIGNGVSETEIAQLPPRGRFRAAHPQIGDRPLVLFLSRLHPKKGLDRLIPVWAALVARHPELRLAIAGGGDAAYVAGLDALIVQHGLSEQVLRVGQLQHEKKWEALVDAEVFVLPSHQEGFSMAITEALAAGCVSVVTEECNFEELESEPKCGVVVHGGDMAAFTTEVEHLLLDSPRRSAMAQAGRELILRDYTWEKVAENMEKLYRFILAGNKLPSDGTDVWR